MFFWKNKLKKEITHISDIKERTPSSERGKTSYDENQYIQNMHKCPDCSSDFLIGPEAGCSFNVACSNEECASKFNIIFPGCTSERLGKISKDRHEYVYGKAN